jgi:hypothetical protein
VTVRHNHVTVAVALVLVPAVACAFTPARGLVELLCVAMIPALVGLLHGVRTAAAAVCGTAALVTACVATSATPWAATVVMVGLGLGLGASARHGLQTLTASAASWPTVLLVAPPHLLEPSPGDGKWYLGAIVAGAVVLLGGAWTLAAMTVLVPRIPRPAAAPLVSRTAASVYALGLALLLGTTADVVTRHAPGTTAGWVLLTIVVTARPDPSLTVRRAVGRATGTVLGAVVASAIGALVPFPPVTTIVGLVGIAAAVVLQLRKSSYAVYSFALTFALVLVDSSGQDFLQTGEQRIAFTMIGAGLSTCMALCLQLVFHHPRRVEMPRSSSRPVEAQESTRDTAAGS